MKKIILGAVLLLVVTIGFGVYYVLSNIDALVKQGVETYGSQATGTSVEVATVHIGLRDGSGTLRGLKVANPEGFAAPTAFSLGEISTRLDLEHMTRDLVTIDEVRVVGPDIYFELNQTGQSNLEMLRQKLGETAGSKKKGAPKASSDADGGKAPELLVRHLLFDEGRIRARVVPLDKSYELKLPRIEMNDLGGKGGTTPERIGAQVLQRLTDVAMQELRKQGLDKYRKQLETQVNQRVDEETRKLEKKIDEKIGSGAGEAIKGLLNK